MVLDNVSSYSLKGKCEKVNYKYIMTHKSVVRVVEVPSVEHTKELKVPRLTS